MTYEELQQRRKLVDRELASWAGQEGIFARCIRALLDDADCGDGGKIMHPRCTLPDDNAYDRALSIAEKELGL